MKLNSCKYILLDSSNLQTFLTDKNIFLIVKYIMETIWIIGAGHFGKLAITRLTNTKEVRLTVVDPVEKNLEGLQVPGVVTAIHEDGINFLNKRLTPEADVDWIIPSLPVHLAWEWCQRRLGKNNLIPVPSAKKELIPLLPNAMEGASNDLYVSFADFICPDNCDEPSQYCTVTGLPRKQNLFDLLQEIHIPGFRSIVLQSQQLSPGIGGVTPEQLFTLLTDIQSAPGQLLISTACRCHGVVTPSLYTKKKA